MSLRQCRMESVSSEIGFLIDSGKVIKLGKFPISSHCKETLDGDLGRLESGLNRIVAKINALPLQKVVTQANEDLQDLHGTLQSVNGGLLPSAITTLTTLHDTLQTADVLLTDDSPFRSNVEDTLGDLQSTLRSVKALADTLNRHPEALIRGRSKDPSPISATPQAPSP